MNTEREKIFQKLIHTPILSFNELWDKAIPSNKFAYHLKVLEEDNLIVKAENGYQLTHEGRRYAAYLDGDSGKEARFPLIGVLVAIYDTKVRKFLMHKRTKEPFFGYWGFPGGKLKHSQYILECAKEEIKEETGLDCDFELKGLFSSKTYNNNVLSYNHQMFVIKATNPKGTLIEQTREGINKWVTVEEISALKTFPNVAETINAVLGDGFIWVEADRFQENDEFKGMAILKNMPL